MLAQQKIVFQKNAAFVGQTIKVLIRRSRHTKKKTAVARHYAQAPDIDGRVLLKKAAGLTPGELISVKIEDFNYYDLVATPTQTKNHEPRPTSHEPRKNKLSLPVVGVISTSVETKGKRR